MAEESQTAPMAVSDEEESPQPTETKPTAREKVVLELGDETVLEEKTIRFVVPNFAAEPEQKLYSETVLVNNVPYRLLLYPAGYSAEFHGQISLYLDLDASVTLPHSFQSFCIFKLGIESPNPDQTYERKLTHVFTSYGRNWGFPRFIAIREALDPTQGFISPDGALTFTATVRVTDGSCVKTWGLKALYDSRAKTGMVGLENQGATCYLNSVLQALFHTNSLRRGVYLMPTDTDESVKNVPLALQRVFYRLQTSPNAVDTSELTKSFGWDAVDSFMQHDVQEFLRVLMDKMDEKMKGTPVEGLVPRLMEGKMKSFVRCTQIDFESSRVEPYLDIQLNVKDMRTLDEAFQDYVKTEELDGENKYAAEGHGLQPARRGITFVSFPPILHLQLKRFAYDPYRDENCKIHTRLEFPDHMNLDKYLVQPDPADPATYTLHSVLVHSGSVHGGHYVAFVRPHPQKDWFRFDDETVMRVSAKDAMDRNFGLTPEDARYARTSTNAYMLVYIRDSQLDEAVREVTGEDVPRLLLERFEREKEEARKREEALLNAAKYTSVEVLREEQFRAHTASGLFPARKDPLGTVVQVLKTATLNEMMAQFEKELGVPVAQQRIFPIISRENKTSRPDPALNPAVDGARIAGPLLSAMGGTAKVFLQELPAPSADGTVAGSTYDSTMGDILLFVKRYDWEARVLSYVGLTIVNKNQQIAEVLPLVSTMAGLAPGTPVLVFEDCDPKNVPEVDPSKSFVEAELQDGDIIIIQTPPPPETPEGTAAAFIQFVRNQVTVEFRLLDKPEERFTLPLDQTMPYSVVAAAVAKHLNIPDPMFLQFTNHWAYHDMPGNKIKHTGLDGEVTLASMLKEYGRRSSNVLYYEPLKVSIVDLENSIRLQNLSWLDWTKMTPVKLDLLVPLSATIGDVAEIVRPQMTMFPGWTGRLRVVQTYDSRIIQDLPLTEHASFYVRCELRVEEIPAEQVDLPPTERLVKVVHFQGDVYRSHGVPFFFRLIDGERVGVMRARLHSFLHVPEAEFAKWRVCIPRTFENVELKDDADISLIQFGATVPLGLEHPDKNPKRVTRWAEKAVKIHN